MATVESSLAPILEPTADIQVAYVMCKAAREHMRATLAEHDPLTREHDLAVEAAEQARRDLEAAIPIRAGWYRLDDRIMGWAKVSKCGFELVNKAAAWSLDHPEGVRWRERQGLVSRILSLQGAIR